MVKAPIRKRLAKRFTAPEFKPYALALGQLTLAWNDLHEALASLYWTTKEDTLPNPGDSYSNEPLWDWHAVKSDQGQRNKLRVAVNESSADWGRSGLGESIQWLLDQADVLGDSRNDAVHSPLLSLKGTLLEAKSSGSVMPNYGTFNRRATKLAKRPDLLAEFRYCRDVAVELAEYARLIDLALINPGRTWPDRPDLPSR
jgi:hypothetical protein